VTGRMKTVLLLIGYIFASIHFAEAQHTTKIPRIGYISGASNMGASEVGFQKGLRELGYIEGTNILVEYRYQEGNAERGPILVAELVKMGVDVLVVIPSRAIRAAKQATKTIPMS
jgi:putative tryptophan/tyrosine transport system substrate-binding protein